MKRLALIENLELAKAALAPNALIPVLQSFVFEKKQVHAYNDRIGIFVPCDTGVEAGVHGDTILGLLTNSGADELTMTTTDKELILQMGAMKSKLPYFNKDEFFFNEPDPEKWDAEFVLSPQIAQGLRSCLMTASADTALPALMGVTLSQSKANGLALYSCDGDALSRYTIGKRKGVDLERSYTMPSDFCDLVLKAYDVFGSPSTDITVDSEWAGAFIPDEEKNETRVYGRIIEQSDPFDHEAHIKAAHGGKATFIEIPEGLAQALQRSLVVVDRETMRTKFTISKNKIELFTESQRGEVKDSIPFKGDHPAVDILINSELVLRALSICTHMAAVENCMVFETGDTFLQIVGNLGD